MCTIKQVDHEITYIVFNPRNEVQIHLNVIKPVVDPGFPRLGAPTARGHQSITWPISLKNCMNMRKLRSRRRAWVPSPPKSAVANELTIVFTFNVFWYWQISLCSGYAREEHVFTSVHSSLQVYVQADTSGGHHRKASTLLYYKGKHN